MKTILITGASSGIGRALAVRAARAGYAVYAVGRNTSALESLESEVRANGGIVVTDAVDISEPAHVPAMIGRMLGAFGRIDVLVNNAGVVAAGALAEQSDEALRVQFGTHVIGPLALVREALPSLRAARGHVFMLGSGVARVPVGGLGAYPPSKAALRSATTILRRELAPLEIAVTYVDPGAVDTAFMTRAGMPGAPENVLVSPEAVARKILLAIGTRPRTINVAPLQTAAVALAELLPGVTDAILTRNPAIVGAGPSYVRLGGETRRDERLALPVTPALPRPAERDDDTIDAVSFTEAETELPPAPAEAAPLIPDVADASAGLPEDARVEPEDELDDAAIYEQAVAEEAADAAAEEAGREDEPAQATTEFDAALQPLHRRMERAKLDPAFVRGLLVPEAVIDVGETAMRWAGMPNKHERALTAEVLFALAEWGFLAPRPDGQYRVVRTADAAHQ